jgi:protein-S-isoprenylcysteine O-methyltransferase Ste14
LTTTVHTVPQDEDTLTRVGGWLFKYRTSIPLPIVVALLVIPPPAGVTRFWTPLTLAGILVIVAGELTRIWGVQHIGAISRTRSDRLGPLIDTGPFSLVRNPLYLGNILLWLGFTLAAQLLWLAPIVAILLAFEYHAIVRWEERLLDLRLGDSYRAYKQQVPRWVPRLGAPKQLAGAGRFTLTETLFSERGTLIAIVAGLLLLAGKLLLQAPGLLAPGQV